MAIFQATMLLCPAEFPQLADGLPVGISCGFMYRKLIEEGSFTFIYATVSLKLDQQFCQAMGRRANCHTLKNKFA